MTVTPEEELWGDRLVRWPSDVVAELALSPADARYLTTVGLPTGDDWSLTMAVPAAGGARHRVRSKPVVAFDGPVPICVDESAGGVLIAMDHDRGRIVNTSVRRFGQFLMLYQRYRRGVRGLDDPDDAKAHAIIDEIERRMRDTDVDAMRDADAYWPIVVEQMRQGLL